MIDATKNTALQNKQYLFLSSVEKMEDGEKERGIKPTRKFYCMCNTCQKKILLHSANGSKNFLLAHDGHYTWFEVENKYGETNENQDN